MPDNDLTVLQEAKETAFSLDKKLRRAVLDMDLDAVAVLKPKVDDAYNQLSRARLKLLEKGVLATDEDVAEIRRIRAEVDQAATVQAAVEGAVRLAVFLAKFL